MSPVLRSVCWKAAALFFPDKENTFWQRNISASLGREPPLSFKCIQHSWQWYMLLTSCVHYDSLDDQFIKGIVLSTAMAFQHPRILVCLKQTSTSEGHPMQKWKHPMLGCPFSFLLLLQGKQIPIWELEPCLIKTNLTSINTIIFPTCHIYCRVQTCLQDFSEGPSFCARRLRRKNLQ